MSFIKNLNDLKSLCRICLISSYDMVPLINNLDDTIKDSPLIVDVLENLFEVKVDDSTNYPAKVCRICYGNLRILHDLKILFNKSQNILKKYISPLQEFEEINLLHNNNTCSDNRIDIESVLQNPSDGFEKENYDFNISKKKLKLQIDLKKQNTVTVKWLEGNKFIMESNKKKSSSNLKCSHCSKVFSSNDKYSSHLKICIKNFSCKYCKNKFHSERSLRSHLRVYHAANPPLEIKCELCNKSFKNYNARSYHKITRHNTEGKKHTCEMCGKAFFFKNSLSQHLECHSRDVSRVVCPICGKSFHYRGGLFYHMKIHRNERNYICSFCNGKFLNMASLKRHVRIHTGERPYTCSYCPKTFCSVSEVRTHERRHTGQKPHKCKYCGKQFITPYNLKLHISSHVGTEPCDVCGKTYLNAEVLKYHMEMKHNIKEQGTVELRAS